MSKELEVIDWLLANETIYRGRTQLPISSYLNNIKHSLLKAQEQEKVLDIIKEKNIDVDFLKHVFKFNQKLEEYNNFVEEYQKLTEEEFNTLKRWLE